MARTRSGTRADDILGPFAGATARRERAAFSAEPPLLNRLESREHWQQHVGGIIESLRPEGHHEMELAVRIAGLLWRLRRVAYYEAWTVSLALDDLYHELKKRVATPIKSRGVARREMLTNDRMISEMGNRLLPDAAAAALIQTHEAHLYGQYVQALHELKALQAERPQRPARRRPKQEPRSAFVAPDFDPDVIENAMGELDERLQIPESGNTS